MKFNINGFIQGSMRILNIVNKTLPLVNEFNSSGYKIIKKIKEKNKLFSPSIPNNTQTLVKNTNNPIFFQ